MPPKNYSGSFYILFVCLFGINLFRLVWTSDIARYDYYRVYHVELSTQKHVVLFQQLEEKSDSCTFFGHARHPKQKLTVMVAAHKVADFADLLQTYDIKYDVLSYNFQEIIDRNLAEVHSKDIDPKIQEHPNDLAIINIEESAQGIPIKGISLKKNKKDNATTIFIESGIHAREWINDTEV